MNTKTIDQANNADMRGSWPALLRAATRAREIAARSGTALVVMQDGELRHIYPQRQPAAKLWMGSGRQYTEPRHESA